MRGKVVLTQENSHLMLLDAGPMRVQARPMCMQGEV